MLRLLFYLFIFLSLSVTDVLGEDDVSKNARHCPGYRVSRVRQTRNSLTAHLHLAGRPCNTYGKDLKHLVLKVEYQTESRLHVKIYDAGEDVYQVPESVFPRPEFAHSHTSTKSALKFSFTRYPFAFSVSRKDTGDVLFDTAGSNLIFQSQYLYLRTSLPEEPNIYGLGEHSDPFRLNTTDYVRTIWNRDGPGLEPGTNLYGTHPVYLEHRGKKGSHGVFLLNSNGMDIKIDKTKARLHKDKQYLEYNILGGVFDFYFLAGPTPKDVAVQYARVAGLPAMVPYWGFGFHQCRYGYRDVFEVAEVVYNYSKAAIPLETMWTDIDYMSGRRIFTLDEKRFPLKKMRTLVDHLHKNHQRYIVMVDPAVSYSDNGAFRRGVEQDAFMKLNNGSLYKAAVWPGVTAYPDWFHPNTQKYWNGEFARFFDSARGVDIDGVWIDMNEAANFCDWPCSDPEGWARDNDLPPDPPPVRENPREIPGFPPIFQPATSTHSKRSNFVKKWRGLPGRDLIDPPYAIQNVAGALSLKTISTDLIHDNGMAEYDTHNLYGSMMSTASREAMLARRPTKRPLVITRSTFAGAGAHVGHWHGDNLSTWEQYRFSIAQMLAFASIFQIPMTGSDVCGFAREAEEKLCARWAMLGAFYPFYRNHNELGTAGQEFYRWESVAEAARNAIEIRYKLLDYLYTAFYHQTRTGEPSVLSPLFYLYPEDKKAFSIDMQFFYGNAVLVSPVTEENATSVDIYLPDDIFYDYYTGFPVRGKGKTVTLDDIPLTHIPLHIRGGTIIPLRASSASTTTELRKQPFNVIVAPDLDDKASGTLYLDDGESIEQEHTTQIEFSYKKGHFKMEGTFDFAVSTKIGSVTVLGQANQPNKIMQVGEKEAGFEYNEKAKKVTVKVDIPLTGSAEFSF